MQSALLAHGDMARQGSLHFSCRQDCLLGQSLSVVHSTLGNSTVQKWQKEKGGVIFDQLCEMGASLDWTRNQFTLSKEFRLAVDAAFIRLFDRGLIYRLSLSALVNVVNVFIQVRPSIG